MGSNPLIEIQQYEQSIWLDDIRRSMMISGELERLIEEDGLRGMTSNPKIFDEAIAESADYDGKIALLARKDRNAAQIYRALTVEDVQMAADGFRRLYDESGGEHGFVSLEVNPHLAYRTQETIEEARDLWKALDRPNVFIKVPATAEGVPAIQQLISEGINVNVTLLFGLDRYREVAEAFLAGLEQRLARGGSIEPVRSVASFFLSRIDAAVDPQLERVASGGDAAAEAADGLRGQIAVASAKEAYRIYKSLFGGERFDRLAGKGARPQRLLWASTSTKNPAYSDVKYVEALIGPETVNTLPRKTLEAFRDHGDARPRLEEGLEKSRNALERLGRAGIDLDRVTRQLEAEGVEKFNKPFDSLMETLASKRAEAAGAGPDSQRLAWGPYGRSISRRLDWLEQEKFCQRLWDRDTRLWADDRPAQKTIANALGWLDAPEKIGRAAADLLLFAREVKAAGFRQVVHMGMGGSSLAPMVLGKSLPPGREGLPLTVLDSTDPAAVAAVSAAAPLENTLFIVASKSGTTTEAVDFMDYFYEQVRKGKGERAGENFVAITDPGTPLVAEAGKRGFRRVFVNVADVGGRYSALTFFGMVPAALMGVDVEALCARAQVMGRACRSCSGLLENPGVMLGAVLGELALQGRDKVTFVMPEAVSTLGMWLEQLLAESTGKQGAGLLPVAGESLGAAQDYGSDRVFVYYRPGQPDRQTEDKIAALRDAGHPVITISMGDRTDLAQEFYRWEIAVAAAGAAIGVNVFDQPNVQESKDNTRRILEDLEEAGSLPDGEPDAAEGGISVFGGPEAGDLEAALKHLFATAAPGDYCAVLAYLTETEGVAEKLAERVRQPVMRRLKIATTLGYGPRYLHSTGQLHKGGPNTGLYLLFTADPEKDLPVPDRPYSFGQLRLAQAVGDFQALEKHGRRVVRIHLGANPETALDRVGRALEGALDALPHAKGEGR